MKLELFTIFDKFAKTGAIFASNTSSLSITDFTDVTVSRDRCVGMHFFNPVPKMKLIELVRTPHTSDETVATCREVAARMGKEVVIVNEAPGFITTRVNALIGNEAFNMLEAGIASAEDIDKALKLGLNHPMGPFEFVDLVGLDVRLNILGIPAPDVGRKIPAQCVVAAIRPRRAPGPQDRARRLRLCAAEGRREEGLAGSDRKQSDDEIFGRKNRDSAGRPDRDGYRRHRQRREQ